MRYSVRNPGVGDESTYHASSPHGMLHAHRPSQGVVPTYKAPRDTRAATLKHTSLRGL